MPCTLPRISPERSLGTRYFPRWQLQPFCHSDQIGERVSLHFLHYVSAVTLYRNRSGPKCPARLPVEHSGNDQPHHFPLPIRQCVISLSQIDYLALFSS